MHVKVRREPFPVCRFEFQRLESCNDFTAFVQTHFSSTPIGLLIQPMRSFHQIPSWRDFQIELRFFGIEIMSLESPFAPVETVVGIYSRIGRSDETARRVCDRYTSRSLVRGHSFDSKSEHG